MSGRTYYCTQGHEPGQHDASCMPVADPDNPELRLLRVIFGLCPLCDYDAAWHSTHPHEDDQGPVGDLDNICPGCGEDSDHDPEQCPGVPESEIWFDAGLGGQDITYER